MITICVFPCRLIAIWNSAVQEWFTKLCESQWADSGKEPALEDLETIVVKLSINTSGVNAVNYSYWNDPTTLEAEVGRNSMLWKHRYLNFLEIPLPQCYLMYLNILEIPYFGKYVEVIFKIFFG
jgi:hypothetical protein